MTDLNRGYPTPDNPAQVTMTTRCVFIPDIPEFVALVGGLLFGATKDYFWRKQGSMTTEEAAELMAQALGLYDAEGTCCMSCEEIVDCIENDPATSLALQQFLAQNGYGTGSGTPDTPTIYTQNPLMVDGASLPTCDNDMLFGAISQLVELMNSTLTDIFEQIEVQTNYIERTQLLLSGIPLVGLLPIDEFIDFADQVIGSLAENYAAQYNNTIRDEYRCDLFCLVKDTCELDFQTFADYFMSRVGQTITIENISAAIEWFVTGVWTGAQVVHAAHALICQFLAYGSQFFNLDMAWLGRAVTSALNDPDPDWLTLCTECGGDFPQLVLGWCNDGNTWGNLVQENANTWLVTLSAAPGGFAAIFKDSLLGSTFRILTIERIGTGIEGGYMTTTPCTLMGPIFGWNNMIGQVAINGYRFDTDVASQIRITVGIRGV